MSPIKHLLSAIPFPTESPFFLLFFFTFVELFLTKCSHTYAHYRILLIRIYSLHLTSTPAAPAEAHMDSIQAIGIDSTYIGPMAVTMTMAAISMTAAVHKL